MHAACTLGPEWLAVVYGSTPTTAQYVPSPSLMYWFLVVIVCNVVNI